MINVQTTLNLYPINHAEYQCMPHEKKFIIEKVLNNGLNNVPIITYDLGVLFNQENYTLPLPTTNYSNKPHQVEWYILDYLGSEVPIHLYSSFNEEQEDKFVYPLQQVIYPEYNQLFWIMNTNDGIYQEMIKDKILKVSEKPKLTEELILNWQQTLITKDVFINYLIEKSITENWLPSHYLDYLTRYISLDGNANEQPLSLRDYFYNISPFTIQRMNVMHDITSWAKQFGLEKQKFKIQLKWNIDEVNEKEKEIIEFYQKSNNSFFIMDFWLKMLDFNYSSLSNSQIYDILHHDNIIDNINMNSTQYILDISYEELNEVLMKVKQFIHNDNSLSSFVLWLFCDGIHCENFCEDKFTNIFNKYQPKIQINFAK